MITCNINKGSLYSKVLIILALIITSFIGGCGHHSTPSYQDETNMKIGVKLLSYASDDDLVRYMKAYNTFSKISESKTATLAERKNAENKATQAVRDVILTVDTDRPAYYPSKSDVEKAIIDVAVIGTKYKSKDGIMDGILSLPTKRAARILRVIMADPSLTSIKLLAKD